MLRRQNRQLALVAPRRACHNGPMNKTSNVPADRSYCALQTALPLAALLLIAAGCAHHQTPPAAQTDYDAIVIGAGMGGLSAAAHLANGGMKVLVLEQHHKVGGMTTSFQRGDFRFETALHEMNGAAPGGPMDQIFEELGLLDKLELIEIPVLYRAIFPGIDFTFYSDIDRSKADLIKRWPAEEENIQEYYELVANIAADVEEIKGIYRESPTAQFFTRMGVPLGQPTFFKVYRKTLEVVLDDLFDDELLKAVIAQFWVYYGPPPSRLWAPIFLLANGSYQTHGAWHFKGSSQALSNAYAARIEELGGKVVTGTRVVGIEVDDGFVEGVATEYGDLFTSRYVVSSADPFQTFFKLIVEEESPKEWREKIRDMKPSNSLLGLYLGLDVPISHWGIEEHEIFYNTSTDADAMYEAMMTGHYEDGAIAVTIYSNLDDPYYAPPGKSVVVVHTYSSIDDWPANRKPYADHKRRVSAKLLALLDKVMPGVADHIEVEEMVTPRTINCFTLGYGGIPYGWDFTVDQGYDRLPNGTPIGGLYLAGSWAGPSHGVSAAQISGRQAAQLIFDAEEAGHDQ
jgi:phytoene dehydrogenase-like protein